MDGNMSKEDVVIYGLGHFYACYEQEINERYNVIAFIDRQKNGYYAGKEIINLSEVSKYCYDKIIIMIQDIQECINILKNLINNHVDIKQIFLGHNIYGKYTDLIDELSVLPDGKVLLTFGNISISIQSKDEFNNVCEVFLNQVYNYYINNGKRDIVLDVGMNIGDSVLYFLHHNRVEKIYGYEPFHKTFISARENLKDYLNRTEKIEIFEYGISNENAKRVIKFNNNMTCGQSSIVDIRDKAYAFYLNEGLIKNDDEESEEIEVKKASEVFGKIIEDHPDHNIVLKMDCEGEEYGILENLFENKVLGNIKYIMMEWHYKGKNTILTLLEKSGFSWWCNDKDKNQGLIYAYK